MQQQQIEIKFVSHSKKLWERIIERRMRKEVPYSDEKFGFIPGMSATKAVFALRQMIKKYREGQKNIQCEFINLEKVYDEIPRQELWNCQREKEVPEKYGRIL